MIEGALIEPEVFAQLLAHRQMHTKACEAGGLLLGFRKPPYLHVTALTAPFPLDRRSRVRFTRCDPQHGLLAKELWQESNGLIDIVGEWHTHPEAHPMPSLIDKRDWQKTLLVQPQPRLFLIVGLASIFYQGTNSMIEPCFPCHS